MAVRRKMRPASSPATWRGHGSSRTDSIGVPLTPCTRISTTLPCGCGTMPVLLPRTRALHYPSICGNGSQVTDSGGFVTVAGDRDRPGRGLRGVLDRPGVGPAHAFVESPGPRVAGRHGEPGAAEAVGGDQLLTAAQQGVRHAPAPGLGR